MLHRECGGNLDLSLLTFVIMGTPQRGSHLPITSTVLWASGHGELNEYKSLLVWEDVDAHSMAYLVLLMQPSFPLRDYS